MSSRANVVNRIVLTVLGLILVAAGGLGLALSAGAFGAWRATDPVLPQEVVTFPDEQPWFWWAVVAGLLLIAVLALFWLLLQLETDRMTRLDLTADAQDGYTRLHASALANAVEDAALHVTGVTGASANLRERGGRHVFLRVDLANSANIAEVRARLEDDVVAHLREAVGEPHFQVMIELRPASTTRQRSVI